MNDPILWVNDPGGAEIARRTGWRTLYDMTDDWLAADRPAAQLDRVAAQELYLLGHADQVVACSPELQRRKSAQRPSEREPVALDPERGGCGGVPAPVTADRPTCRPDRSCSTWARCTVTVSISALCETLARQLGDAGTLVLVGPNALPPAASARLRDAGVILLGPRPHDEVIALPSARRCARRAARGDVVHRQPRPDQALRVPGGRAAGRVDRGRRLPGRRRRQDRHRRCLRASRMRSRRRSRGCRAVPGRRRSRRRRLERSSGRDARHPVTNEAALRAAP